MNHQNKNSNNQTFISIELTSNIKSNRNLNFFRPIIIIWKERVWSSHFNKRCTNTKGRKNTNKVDTQKIIDVIRQIQTKEISVEIGNFICKRCQNAGKFSTEVKQKILITSI